MLRPIDHTTFDISWIGQETPGINHQNMSHTRSKNHLDQNLKQLKKFEVLKETEPDVILIDQIRYASRIS